LKTINATLLSNQKLPNGRGYASASLADNNRLHPLLVVTDAYTGGNTIAVECGTFYERLRYKSGGSGTLEVQKITDPTVSAQWTTWNALVATNVFAPLGIAIFWTGTYVVVCWQDTATGEVKYKRSSDGTTFSATATVRAFGAVAANLAGVSGQSPDCGLMMGFAQQVGWIGYNHTTDTWTATDTAATVFTTFTPMIAAFKDTANSRYIVAMGLQGFANWATNAITLFTRAVSSATWSAGQVILSSATDSFLGLQFSQRQVSGYWWLSFYRSRLWNVGAISNYFVSASNDGVYWDDPCPSTVPGNELSLCILPAPSGLQWTSQYLSTEHKVYQLQIYNYWSARVVAYHLISGHGGF
jgi:hypothetical protein